MDKTSYSRVKLAMESRPAVRLTGARQTGKSSLLQKEFPDIEYVTYEE
ncbi:MAG: hypothetical protein KKD44_15345 [Proteobacteria bacterium]|nr:hypothetical protein [Pseudomonadota bacterium]